MTAEILDKSAPDPRAVPDFGQVQALTGEGRLSGIVFGLPPAPFAVVYHAPDYLMLLFTTHGQKKLIGGVVMQLLGAAIRKIVNIQDLAVSKRSAIHLPSP